MCLILKLVSKDSMDQFNYKYNNLINYAYKYNTIYYLHASHIVKNKNKGLYLVSLMCFILKLVSRGPLQLQIKQFLKTINAIIILHCNIEGKSEANRAINFLF